MISVELYVALSTSGRKLSQRYIDGMTDLVLRSLDRITDE